MAYTSCAAKVANNIAKDCNNPLVNGYTGRGVLIALSDAPTLTYDANNKRIISAVTLGEGVNVCVIDNAFSPQPLSGCVTASNTDDGFMKYRKTVQVAIPLRGAAASKAVVEPLAQAPLGYLVILEKKDRSGDGSFEVIGAEQGLVAEADGITRNEYENGGCVVATLSCNENAFENVFFDTSYQATIEAFERLISRGF